MPPPPTALLIGAALFLDFDGTLVPIADTPDSVRVDSELVALLVALRARLAGRLAIVSGRSVETLRGMGLGDFLLAGTHGLELAPPGRPVDAPPPLPAIDMVEQHLLAFIADRPGLLVERKPLSVGLHFRLAPLAANACEAVAVALAGQFGLHLQRGKMLFELRPGGADKGSAVTAMMAHAPMAGGIPLFLGDDLTDEEGFAAAVALGGHGILVGPQRSTLASWSLEQVGAVRHYLAQGVAAIG